MSRRRRLSVRPIEAILPDAVRPPKPILPSNGPGLMPPAISLVIPVFNEEAILPELFAELRRVGDGVLKPFGSLEVILVNDGSRDRSWELIAAVCRATPGYLGVNLSRNFGHQIALAAGLQTARGDVVVSLDADLQDPPEFIVELLAAHRRGYDVVYATRRQRGKESLLKRTTAAAFYRLIERLSDVPIPRNTGDFRLLSRRALTELARLGETHRFLRGLAPWIGFPQTQVYFDRSNRTGGRTHYSLPKMILLAFDGIASMSTAPLRLAYLLSLVLFAVFVSYIFWVVYQQVFRGGTLVPGWTSVMCAITIFGTIQLLLLGVFGEYLGRIYEQVKERPLFIVQDLATCERPVVPSPPT